MAHKSFVGLVMSVSECSVSSVGRGRVGRMGSGTGIRILASVTGVPRLVRVVDGIRVGCSPV